MSQLIEEPTWVTEQTKTLINHFITNNKEGLAHCGVITTSFSDHNLIFAVRNLGIPRGSPRYVETRSFKNFNDTKFTHDIKNTTWPTPTSYKNINNVWEEWKLTMQGILDKHTPCRTKKVRNKPFSWINSEVKHEMYARDLLKKKATKSNSPADWLLFRQKQNTVIQLVRKTKKHYYQKEIKKNLGSPKGTWRLLSNIMGNKAKTTEIK